MGDAKLHYVGYSYGTEIGEQYLRDFPTHVGAMVLDTGVVVPGEDPITSGHDQIKSFETDLDAFLADCAGPALVHLRSRQPQGRAAGSCSRSSRRGCGCRPTTRPRTTAARATPARDAGHR